MRRPRGEGSATSVCQRCGQSFTHAARFSQKFCSRECKYAAQSGARNWVGTFTCTECGKSFEAARTLERKTCSKECQNLQYSRLMRDLSTHILTTCPVCEREFTFDRSWPRKHCSKVCAGKANVANIPGFAPSRFVAQCQMCGVQFETTPKRTRGRFCSRKCWGAWLSASETQAGERSPNWRGGHEPYYGGSWRGARRAARARDGRCLDCGLTPAALGKALDVHHLVPFRLFGVARHREANALSNLVSLCPPCHMNREWGANRRPH